MSNRISALAQILGSPSRILGIVLVLVFTVEVAVMFLLPYLLPGHISEASTALLDAVLLTAACAPVLWWVIISPLRRIAVQEHQRSETIVAHASEGILTFGQDFRIASCNRAGAELLGRPAEQLVGQLLHKIIPEFPERLEGLPLDLPMQAIRPEGERIPVQVSVSQFPSRTDRLCIAILRDLTQSLLAEQQRLTMARETEALRAQQMATLAQLATGVAHEIRNPLTSIKMLIQVNRAKFAEEGLPTGDLELVEQEIRRMERSVNGLLDYARPEKSEFAAYELQAPIRRTVQLIEGRCVSANVVLDVHVPPQPVAMRGDKDQIQQLLLNLCLNALDAMPSGGRLELCLQVIDAQAEVAIIDTGTGISPQVLEKMFSPFVTAKAGGVGLGLGICRRIAEAHHGSLSGDNRPEGGAAFCLRLPLPQLKELSGLEVVEGQCKNY